MNATPWIDPEGLLPVRVRVMGVIEGCTNPESAELLEDGETIVLTNCAMTRMQTFRKGRVPVYMRGAAYLSLGRIGPAGDVELLHRVARGGMTATLGCDVIRSDSAPFPRGTVLQTQNGGPVTSDGTDLVPWDAGVLVWEPLSGDVLGVLPLGDDSPVGRRWNGVQQPNGLAVDAIGNLYVTDIPNTAPDLADGWPVPPAVYRIPADALLALIAGGEEAEAAAAGVQRVEMPGSVNGVTVSPVDQSVWAVSCSLEDPAQGGVYRLMHEDFDSGVQPEAVHQGLGILDGVTITRRGTLLVSNPRSGQITAFPDGRAPVVLAPDQGGAARQPADINVIYPAALGGEPALLVPDVAVGSGAGESRLAVYDISGL